MKEGRIYQHGYTPRPWTPEKREAIRQRQLARWGNPVGFCTVYGIHVPLEHGQPVKHWAGRLAEQYGRCEAEKFVESLKAEEWASMPRIRDLWLKRREAYANEIVLRQFRWELRHANKNNR